MRRPALLLLGLALPGCLEETDGEGAGTPAAAARAVRFSPPSAAILCKACYEPSLATLPDGSLLVAISLGGPLARSDDGGRTFVPASPVPRPSGAASGFYLTDALLQTDPAGRLFHTALVWQRSPGARNVLNGFQVARSSDGGATWDLNRVVSILGARRENAAIADRPWLGFARVGTHPPGGSGAGKSAKPLSPGRAFGRAWSAGMPSPLPPSCGARGPST